MKNILKTIIKTLLIQLSVFWFLFWTIAVFALTFPFFSPSWETSWWLFYNYFNKILVNTSNTTNWVVKKAQSLWNETWNTTVVSLNWNNVWIWTPNPSAKLHVNWNVTASTPTSNSHLTTKQYVDNLVSASAWTPIRWLHYWWCTWQANSSFSITTSYLNDASLRRWPATGCATSWTNIWITCASWYSPFKLAPIQMNCAPNPSTTRTTCYWQTAVCVKD